MATRGDIVGLTLAFTILSQLPGQPAIALAGGVDFVDVALQRHTVAVASTKGRCTGVMLAQDIVLTAAHCTREANNLWVGGSWGDPSNPPVGLSRVTETVQHPRYKSSEPGGSTDLAVLKLEKPLPDQFLPAFFGAPMPRNGDDLIATGYGESAPNDPKAGTILRMVLLRVSGGYKGNLVLVSRREEDAGSGHGDSGGPLFTYRGLHALVGIIVAGSSSMTVAVAIAPNYQWIEETVEKLHAP